MSKKQPTTAFENIQLVGVRKERTFGPSSCADCGKVTPLPGKHEYKPSYAELEAELDTAKDENKRSGEDCIVRMQEARKQGYIAGLSRFAWWRLGVQYVGTSGTTLKQAIDEGE